MTGLSLDLGLPRRASRSGGAPFTGKLTYFSTSPLESTLLDQPLTAENQLSGIFDNPAFQAGGVKPGGWAVRNSGTTGSSGTGPGSNSTGPYLYTETSGGADFTQIQNNFALNFDATGVRALNNVDIRVTAELCMQGEFNNNVTVDGETLKEHIAFQVEQDGSWNTAARMFGSSYSATRKKGDSVTDYGNVGYTVSNQGGWREFTFTARGVTDFRMHLHAAGGTSFRHDIAIRNIRIEINVFPPALPSPFDLTLDTQAPSAGLDTHSDANFIYLEDQTTFDLTGGKTVTLANDLNRVAFRGATFFIAGTNLFISDLAGLTAIFQGNGNFPFDDVSSVGAAAATLPASHLRSFAVLENTKMWLGYNTLTASAWAASSNGEWTLNSTNAKYKVTVGVVEDKVTDIGVVGIAPSEGAGGSSGDRLIVKTIAPQVELTTPNEGYMTPVDEE